MVNGLSPFQSYTRGDYSSLPTDTTNLETSFSDQDYLDVETDNNIYVLQLAAGEHAIFQFKDKNLDGYSAASVLARVKSSTAASTAPIYLQIYNQTTNSWETLDVDHSTAANTEFILSGAIPT